MYALKSINSRVVGVSEEEDDYLDAKDDDISDSFAPVGTGIPHYLLSQPREWHPLYLKSKFKETESRDGRCAVAILLPSVVHEHTERIKIEIEQSSTLRATTYWPTALKKQLNHAAQFPECDRCEENRAHTSHNSGIERCTSCKQPDTEIKKKAVARPILPFPVKPDTQHRLCAYQDSATKILLFSRKGPTWSFAKSNVLITLTASCTTHPWADATSGST